MKCEFCENIIAGRGLCAKHYKEYSKAGLLKDRPYIINKQGEGGVSQYGYYRITVDKKRIFEHRHIMEKYLGRKLEKNERVHHINGDKLDNKIENLQLVTQSEHVSLHRKQLYVKRRKRLKNKCLLCGQEERATRLCKKHYSTMFTKYRRSANKEKTFKEFLKNYFII